MLVTSEVVGNHRYSVPEFATWQTIVEQNDKVFAVATDGTNCIVSLAAKAAKVGGLYLTLKGVAVKPHGRRGREEGVHAGVRLAASGAYAGDAGVKKHLRKS